MSASRAFIDASTELMELSNTVDAVLSKLESESESELESEPNTRSTKLDMSITISFFLNRKMR